MFAREKGEERENRGSGPRLQSETSNVYHLERFSLFKTSSYFYLVGRDQSERFWRVLKIHRSDPSKLVVHEDPTVFSWPECALLLQRIDKGNRKTGGLTFVTVCYGIVGCVKFLGPYYLLLITKRRKTGELFGHPIYGVSEWRMIQISHAAHVPWKENRYKKLLCTINLAKGFFFSYTYPLMHTLQHNLCDSEGASLSYDSPFVWNGYLSKEIRDLLRSTLWTVALVHGFFRQVQVEKAGRTISTTLVARRSSLHAGPRYLARGVNENGEAANDVETEQIACTDFDGRFPNKISSIVQNRGSIPLTWRQKVSWFTRKPDVIVSCDRNSCDPTGIHFKKLERRYGNPIVILNLVKSCKKNPRESLLKREFGKAVAEINMGLEKEKFLQFVSLDLNGLFKIEGASVLTLLAEIVAIALDLTGLFVYQFSPPVIDFPCSRGKCEGACFSNRTSSYSEYRVNEAERKCQSSPCNVCKHSPGKPVRIQHGVLRTNCIDCLDRTNVAQFVLGLIAFGQQLRALGITDLVGIDLDDRDLVDKLLEVYVDMGDALGCQYVGSGARCKIFGQGQGQWKFVIELQELLKTLQRYLSNTFLDVQKQHALNLFLGHCRPGVGEPAEAEPDNLKITSSIPGRPPTSRLVFQRSISDTACLFSVASEGTPSEIGVGVSSDGNLGTGLGGKSLGTSTSESDLSWLSGLRYDTPLEEITKGPKRVQSASSFFSNSDELGEGVDRTFSHSIFLR